MTFRARLRRHSSVWHLWERHNRLGGLLCAVQFRRAAPGEYVTDELTSSEVFLLRGHDAVLIEATTQPVPAVPMPISESLTYYPQVREAPAMDRETPRPPKGFPPEVPETHVSTPAERRAERQQRLRRGRDQRSSFAKYD